MFVKLAVALLLSTLAWTSSASETYVDLEKRLTAEQRQATGLDTLSAEQLALLNRLLREEQAVQERAAPAPVTASREPDPSRHIGYTDGPVKARVKGAVSGWQPGMEFHLDNGQVWKVLKGEMKLDETLQDPEILVVPGIAGRWFLQVHEDLPKARVYRID